MTCEGDAARTGANRNEYKILVGKPQGTGLLEDLEDLEKSMEPS
jgi:hypothetical protein